MLTSAKRSELSTNFQLINHLNEQQRQAVTHKDGSILVIAGAGTGKTRVITERIAHILNEKWAETHEVLGLTFTDKAADEMRERLDVLMPIGYPEIPLFTFHAFCGEVLRDFGADIGISPSFKILQGVEQWQLVHERLFDFELDYYRPLGNPTRFIDALTKHFERIKEELVTPERYQEFADEKMKSAADEAEKMEAVRLAELAKAFAFYEEMLDEGNWVDYSGLQTKLIELLTRRPNILRHLQNRFKYVLVDEYQDTNIAQNKIVDLLVQKHGNVMAVGDDDQSIYKFRGAAISNILQFTEKYPQAKKVVLTHNYRSNQSILDFAYQSIQHNNPDRLEIRAGVQKKLEGARPGSPESVTVAHFSTVDDEVDYVIGQIKESKFPVSEIAVLTRANAYAQPYIEAFRHHSIPYHFPSEKGLYGKPEIRDLIAVLSVIANPADDISFHHVLRFFAFRIPMEAIAEVTDKTRKAYSSLWNQAKKTEACALPVRILSDLLDYSKNHTAGEVLYRFAESVKLYETLLAKNSIEAEQEIVNIASFFEKMRQFERSHAENSVADWVSYLELADEAGENPSAKFEVEGREGVQVSTIHAAKGLEFEMVFISSMTNDRFPAVNRRDSIEVPAELISEVGVSRDFHVQEERRLFYVAATRAKEKLHLLHSDFYNPSVAEKPRSKKRSRFIDEVEGKAGFAEVEKTTEGVSRFVRKGVMKNDDAHSPEGADGHPRLQGAPSAASPQPLHSFSFSQLSTFERCPRQFQYSYLFKIPTPPDGSLSFGTTMHSTLLEFYRGVEQKEQASLFTEFTPDLSVERLLTIYDEKWLPLGYESRAHMMARKERGKEILKKFHERFKANMPQILYLEKGFKLKLGDYTLGGRIDRADERSDGTLEIIDYKTGKARDEKEVEKDLQLALYAIAAKECFGKTAGLLTLHFLDEDKKVSVEPKPETLEEVKAEVVRLADEVNKSDFKPTPEKFTCQYCPYRKICDAAMG